MKWLKSRNGKKRLRKTTKLRQKEEVKKIYAGPIFDSMATYELYEAFINCAKHHKNTQSLALTQFESTK